MTEPETEPIRRNLYPAAIVVALATFLGTIAVADPLTLQTVAAAGSLSLTEFSVLAFGIYRARDKAWSPASVNEIIDADAVIAAAEHRQ